MCLFKVDPFYVICVGEVVKWVCLWCAPLPSPSPTLQHHDDGGAPEVSAEEMSSGV